MPLMGPAVQQECLTLCTALDFFSQGKIAGGMDLLSQRLKALEAIARGGHWTVARQHELVSIEHQGISEEGEAWAAARRAREQERLKNLVSRAATTKGVDYSQGGGKTRKGKEKGTGKGGPSDGGKSKSSGGGKEEGKASWQKKKES